jgi:isopenicillin N synthase-like dioxygenase
MTSFYWELHQAALRVLDALMLALDLLPAEQDALRALHSGHYSQMRLAHYLPVSDALAQDNNMFRLAAHKDFGCVTLQP